MKKMNNKIRPRVVVSKCLGFAKCRYNGAVIPNHFISELTKYVDFIEVCPEVEIGLGVPRDPIRIVKKGDKNILFQPKTGKDFTSSMNKFTKKFISELKEIDGFILKYKSPSCGKNNVNIYYHNEDRKPLSGKGFFGGSIQEKFSHLAIEDEGRLNNFTIRENWLTQLFVLAEFRVIEKNINALVKFHSRNKLLFMAYNQVRLKEMGRVVANNGSLPVKEVFSNYYNLLCDLLNRNPNFHKWINALMHAFGGINSRLTSEEKVFFLDKLEEYRDERIPKSVLKGILESWAIRFNNEYLLSQSILNPYPKELNEITDSGKGRNY